MDAVLADRAEQRVGEPSTPTTIFALPADIRTRSFRCAPMISFCPLTSLMQGPSARFIMTKVRQPKNPFILAFRPVPGDIERHCVTLPLPQRGSVTQ
jgi:hypothetical protein